MEEELKTQPFMAYEEKLILDQLLEERQPSKCLEYGGGGSSIYFPKNHPYITQWDVIEDSKYYANMIKEHKIPEVNVYYVPDLEEYVTYPMELGKYDFILIDGVDETRNYCMQFSTDHLLNKGGIVVLHDSGRKRYKESFKYFDHHKELAPGVGKHPDGGADFRGLTMFWND